MSIREIFAKICKESHPRPVVHPTTLRARPRLEALEIRLTPSGVTGEIVVDAGGSDALSTPSQVGSP